LSDADETFEYGRNLLRCGRRRADDWSLNEPNFLCVSGTHGSAQLALYDQDGREQQPN
jgi:hypothetical protein